MGKGSAGGWRKFALAALLIVGLFGGVALGTMLASGDADGAGPSASPSPSSAPGATTTTVADGASSTAATSDPPPSVRADFCSQLSPGEPFLSGPSVTLADLGEVEGVRVEGALYPRPDYPGDPWSQWGQGLALPDGRFYSAIGDHEGPDGNSFIYEYDPSTGSLSMVGDLLSYVDHQSGSWGYGKVHGQMVAGGCGEIYLSSYWGTYRGIRFDDSYRGDILFRLDPEARTIGALGVPVDQHGQASLAGWAQGGLVYGEAVDPVLKNQDIEQGPFFAYDVVTGELVFRGPDSPHVGYRAMIVDQSGRAYYSLGGGELAVYDPTTNELGTHPHRMPADWLRAAASPAPDGRVAAVTDEPYTFFVMHPSGDIQTLGPAQGYTASLALHPDGDRFFYVPHAHGGSADFGTPLIEVDLESGEERVLARLNPLAEQGLGITLGGSYNVVADPGGERLYVGMNSGPDGFGEIVLLVVHLP